MNMSPSQCRMARAALKWTTQDLAKAAGVGANTVNRYEAGQDTRLSSLGSMMRAFAEAGVAFREEDGRECVCVSRKEP